MNLKDPRFIPIFNYLVGENFSNDLTTCVRYIVGRDYSLKRHRECVEVMINVMVDVCPQDRYEKYLNCAKGIKRNRHRRIKLYESLMCNLLIDMVERL